MRPLLVLAVLLLVGTAGASAGTAGQIQLFRTPSVNIGCIYSPAAGGLKTVLRCDIRSGIKPKPARPKNCDLEYGDSYELQTTGRAIVVCHGDTAIDPRAKVLGYGKTWRVSPFTCTSTQAGLRCKNGSGHGFFLSREHSYRF